MKIQNIIALVVLASTVFVGCKKDNSIELREKPVTETSSFQPSLAIEGEEDENEEVTRGKTHTTVALSQANNTPVTGVSVTLFNADYSTSGVSNASGVVSLSLPANGQYKYQVMHNGIVLVDEFVNITNSTLNTVHVE